MTYRGSMPGSGYGQNPGQQQWPQQQNMQNGFDAYGNPHSQYPQYSNQQYGQYQNAVFAPVGYPQQTAPNTNYAGLHPGQYQSYDPSFDQRPQQSSQYNGAYGAQMGQMQSAAQQPVQQPVQRPSNQYMPQVQQQQHQQQHQQLQQYQQQQQTHAHSYDQPQHHQVHQSHQTPQQAQHVMDWQQMPPPNQSPIPQYQTIPPNAMPQRKQTPQQQHVQQPHRQKSVSSHANSPRINSPHANSPMTQSPQLPQQNIPAKSRSASSASVRIDQAGRVSASPRLMTQGLTRSPSVSSVRSPAPTPGLIPHHQDTNSLLVCVAEELFTKARKEVLRLADTLDPQGVQEYQKMVATGLGCLETVLSSNKLAPKVEAKLQLRYASILCEETNNIMEAETALAKGITLCEKYRFADLKYLMQFLQLRMLSQRKGKAAMIAVDQKISDAELLKHTHWVYALRFFKASLYLQSSNPSDIHALENLRAIMALAHQRGDTIIFVVASLLEGLSLLKNMKDDAVVKIQNCLAQSQKYQLDPSVHVPQVDILILMLDFACSLHQKSPQMIMQKMKLLQTRMDNTLQDHGWSLNATEVLLPIKKQSSNNQVISEDTRAIIQLGGEHDNCDYLAMSFWTKIEAFIMTYTYSGLGLLYSNPRNDKRIFELWDEALGSLTRNAHKMRTNPASLSEAMRSADWRRELKCYLQIVRGLHLATISRWQDVWKCVEELESLVRSPLEGIVGLYSCYLSGVYHQGTGNLGAAKTIYEGALLSLESNLDANGNIQGLASTKQGHAELEVRVLSAFNRVWIMQHPDHRDDRLTTELIELLRPLCTEHPNLEIRTAFNLILAATHTSPPIGMTAAKNHLAIALNGAKTLGDVHTLSIALNLMRAKLFQNIVGDQALKSAKAGAAQARKAGNRLWMSVAEGLLAQSYEVQGQMTEARQAWDQGAGFAGDALGGAPPPS
ncbi:putative 75k gamma secalin [Seiridium cardinale]